MLYETRGLLYEMEERMHIEQPKGFTNRQLTNTSKKTQ